MATNEYGVELNKNGYAPSILGAFDDCYLCHREGDLARHEIFHGALRQKSKAYGLWIHVCPMCHELIHNTPKKDLELKTIAQRNAMLVYGWSVEDFRVRFYKNYVDE